MCACVRACMHVCMCSCVRNCVSVRACVYVYMCVYIHIHALTKFLWLSQGVENREFQELSGIHGQDRPICNTHSRTTIVQNVCQKQRRWLRCLWRGFPFFCLQADFQFFPFSPFSSYASLRHTKSAAIHANIISACFFMFPRGFGCFLRGGGDMVPPKMADKCGRQMWLRFELRTNVALHTHVCGITHTQFHSKTHVHVWERMYIRIHTHVWGFRAYQLFRGSCCQMCVCVYLSDQCGITHTYVNKHKPACACEGFELIAFYRLQLPDVCVCVLVWPVWHYTHTNEHTQLTRVCVEVPRW